MTIQDIAFGGEGVARVEDFVIFVPAVLNEEVVEVELTEVKKRFGRARLLGVLKSAPERVRPECAYFGICGGCQYQHIDYAAQTVIKLKQVRDLFSRIGGLDPNLVREVIPCPQVYHYRNRIMIRSQWDKYKQGLNIGYIRADSRLVVDIEQCAIAERALNDQIQRVRANPPPKGGLKVVLRIPPEDWEVPPDSFFQNNFHLLPRLVDVVRNLFAESGSRNLVDVYCGVGFFGLELADLAERFVGVELDRLAINAARENARKKNRFNGEFIAGAVEEVLPEVVRGFRPETTTVLLDPPRTGCRKETIELLRNIGPNQVIYVSCHPATMARDLNALSAANVFKVVQVSPLDMFPQTAHIECVADLRLHQTAPDTAAN